MSVSCRQRFLRVCRFLINGTLLSNELWYKNLHHDSRCIMKYLYHSSPLFPDEKVTLKSPWQYIRFKKKQLDLIFTAFPKMSSLLLHDSMTLSVPWEYLALFSVLLDILYWNGPVRKALDALDASLLYTTQNIFYLRCLTW